jgi:hypothetical protein
MLSDRQRNRRISENSTRVGSAQGMLRYGEQFAVDHAGRALEDRRDGRALHGKAGRTSECR